MSEVRILQGDCREVLRTLPSASVHCVVTSPPYWGLRDYGTAKWAGGDPECGHKVREKQLVGTSTLGGGKETISHAKEGFREECPRCGARRIDSQIGLERSLGEHVDTMVNVFREVRRVLRKNGTLWLNSGDSYATAINGRSAADTKAAGNDDRTFRDKPFSTIGPIYNPNAASGEFRGKNINRISTDADLVPRGRIEAGGYLKPKDLCGIPWRVAFALQADGWWLRQDIIWSKPNPMPESVTDRCTKAHEYIFLLSKSERYFYDAEAITEQTCWQSKMPDGWDTGAGGHGAFHRDGREKGKNNGAGGTTRNKRSVWEIATSPFPEAHFATFPPALIEPCIKAGCPPGGCVLDPFGGAGTTGLVADRLGRNAILIELNPEYAALAERRLRDDAGMFAQVAAE